MGFLKCIKPAEISNSGITAFHFIGNAKNGGDLYQRRRHHLTVKYGLSKISGRLCPRDPPLRLRPRRRLLKPSSYSSSRRRRHSLFLVPKHLPKRKVLKEENF
uniref:Callose synthase 3 n=1 Tax=Rhizophora mucronata TaxID=61149 RepID=A0A2P2MMS1_RHIMU